MTLSQDEINALLESKAGDSEVENDTSAESPATADEAGVEEQSTEDVPSPQPEAVEEDDPLADILNTLDSDEAAAEPVSDRSLTLKEIDLLGEVGNICMGAVATTMYTLLDRRVNITTPRVSVHATEEVLREFQTPFVVVEVQYVEGIFGKNMLMLKEYDAALITDLLMGGEGNVTEPVELNELHMSAISEIMNQMIGASATALSKIVGHAVNISPPRSNHVSVLSDDSTEMLGEEDLVVKISFDMEIEGLLKSELLQLLPYDLSRELAKKLSDSQEADSAANEALAAAALAQEPEPEPASAPMEQAPAVPQESQSPQAYNPNIAGQEYPYPPPAPDPQPGQLVDVRPMQFTSFDANAPVTVRNEMDLVYDIPLTVSVELGKTKKDISEILEFGNGTVVVLEKLAGEHVEVLANGKLIAKGEVVVIDDNYGVRITEVVHSGRI